MKVEAKSMEMEAATAKIIYHEVLNSITLIDEEEYDYYINARRRRLATWKSYKERADEGYYEAALELAPPSFYVREEGSNEVTVYKVAIHPPRSQYLGYKMPASEIGLKVIYLEELGKVEIDMGEDGYPRGRVVASWRDSHNYAGCFENKVVRIRSSAFLLDRIWRPRFGYCGSARQLYLITPKYESD